MNLLARVKKLESRKTQKQTVTVLLPDWLSDEPIVYESKHFGSKDIKPEVPENLRGIL